MKIIGIAGLALAGKSTAAAAIATAVFERGYHPVMERFAGPLKDASDTVGFKKGGDTDAMYRQFCQFVGTMARTKSAYWWVNLLNLRAEYVAQADAAALDDYAAKWSERVLIIDDLRYANEVAWVRENGGRTIFVSAMGRLTDLDAEYRRHSSEDMAKAYENGQLEDDLFDFSISNNDPQGLDEFTNSAAALGLQIVQSAHEEMK